MTKETGITYHNTVNSTIAVKIDGRISGHIRTVNGFWQYWPKGSKIAGELFPTLDECQKSLESE
jgi:hypothetical protein